MASAITSVKRPLVVWRGPSPPAAVEFERRGLRVEQGGDEGVLRFACAVVIEAEAAPVDIGTVTASLDHGAAVWIVAQTDAKQQDAWNAVNAAGLADRVVFRTAPELWEVAERIARDEMLPGEGDVKIDGDVAAGTAFLLRRAFADCKSLLVQPLTPGYSATAFRVHAVFRDSAAGPRPLPFFAKVDTVAKIRGELGNYGMYVDRYIPFYLRPHLDHRRCLYGSKEGILVGDFVEHSETLADVLPRGRAQGALHSLFDEALRGWRLQSLQEPMGRAFGSVASEIFQFKLDRFDAGRVAAAKAFGAVHTPEQLVARLYGRQCAYRKGPMHGDLHAKNVQVRGGDAILIDFAMTKLGPVVADPASLEVDIAFSCPSQDRARWRAMIDKLYGSVAVEEVPPPAEDPTEREYVWNAVRQVRMHALARRPEEHVYQIAVATYLLRRASFPSLDAEDEQRRTYAYALADQIIRSL